MTQAVQSGPHGEGADEFRLDGYVALVTGAGRGIGAGIAQAYARAGADLVLVARTATDLGHVAAGVRALGRTASVIPADLTDVPDSRRDEREQRLGAGEDPVLGAAFAAARVRGFQGDDYSAVDKIVACAKHWVAYGAAEAGRDYNTVDVSERTLRTIFYPPFKAAVDAGAGSVMSAFNDLNGIPASVIFRLARVIRRAMVVSCTRNARAIWAVVRPHTTRRVSAI